MEIYLMRHGETDWNREEKLQGREDIPLNEEGKRMAEATAKAIEHLPISKIYSSPLIRAVETAEIVRGERSVPIIRDSRLIEIGFGEYEGMRYNKNSLEEYGELKNFFLCPHKYVPPKGAESIQSLRERTYSFMQSLLINSLEEEDVLITTHGAALSAILANVLEVGDALLWGDGVHANCGVSHLRAKDARMDKVEIIEYNIKYC